MSSLPFLIFKSTSLITLSLYHLITTTHSSPPPPPHLLHPLPLPNHPHLRLLPHYLTLLLLSATTLLLLATSTTTTSSLLSLLFLLPLLSSTFSLLPSDLSLLLLSSSFFLHRHHLLTPSPPPSLSSTLSSTSALISAASSLLSSASSFLPRLHPLLAASLLLHGLWSLHSALTLHVDAFIPLGCHRLLDSASTTCDLDESRLRAASILDAAFLGYVVVVMIVVIVVYASVSRFVGGSARRLGSYEALPNAAAGLDTNHVQLKTLTGTQA